MTTVTNDMLSTVLFLMKYSIHSFVILQHAILYKIFENYKWSCTTQESNIDQKSHKQTRKCTLYKIFFQSFSVSWQCIIPFFINFVTISFLPFTSLPFYIIKVQVRVQPCKAEIYLLYTKACSEVFVWSMPGPWL